MKIDKEQFNKLKQLDRIEFRQRKNIIEENLSLDFGVSFVIALIIIGLLCILISMNIYQMGDKETALSMAEVGLTIFKIAFLFIVVSILINFIVTIYKIKKLKELQEEYFNTKIEVKK